MDPEDSTLGLSTRPTPRSVVSFWVEFSNIAGSGDYVTWVFEKTKFWEWEEVSSEIFWVPGHPQCHPLYHPA